MIRERNPTLDYLRGFSIIIMIFTHSLAYYLSVKTAFWLWDYSHFVVPILIFISSYLYFEKSYALHLNQAISYFKSRAIRLLIPYYIFLIPYFILVWTFDRHKLNLRFFLSSIYLGDSVDISWLVLLFLMLTILLPLVHYLQKYKIKVFYLLGAASILSAVFLMFYRFPSNYKLIMWAPWLLVVAFTHLVLKQKNFTRNLVAITGLCVFTFLVSRLFLQQFNDTLVLQFNKYPPNIYYLSYGLSMVLIFYLFFRSKYFNSLLLKKIFTFLSRYSYSLFFIQYLVIYYVSKLYEYSKWPWFIFFFVILVSSILIQKVLIVASELNSQIHSLLSG